MSDTRVLPSPRFWDFLILVVLQVGLISIDIHVDDQKKSSD